MNQSLDYLKSFFEKNLLNSVHFVAALDRELTDLSRDLNLVREDTFVLTTEQVANHLRVLVRSGEVKIEWSTRVWAERAWTSYSPKQIEEI